MEWKLPSTGLTKNAYEDVKRFIVDVVQPYNGGKGEMILNLHDLDIEDKHRLSIAHPYYWNDCDRR
jgi:hypothetical protein